MISTQSGALRLFRVSGIDVYLHWTWFLAAWYFIGMRAEAYTSLAWNVAEYVTLFAIVLLHEFGHAFASRQVGGDSREIILWPFGGIAFAKVPPRPGAELWAVAAGPLVNVVLAPILLGVLFLAGGQGWTESNPELGRYLVMIFKINLGLLFFNILPVYPLDGGQMLRALLWFKLGRATSLRVATVLGFVAIPTLLLWRYLSGDLSVFTLMIGGFLALECHRGFKHAEALTRLARLPRHTGFACPICRERPPGGPLWGCPSCGNAFDPFSTRAVCPHCATVLPKVTCPHCGEAQPPERWDTGAPRRPAPPGTIDV